MIKEVSVFDLDECVKVIRESFVTVVNEFGITEQNAPRYTAFSITYEKLYDQYKNGRKMFAYFDNNVIVGFYALEFSDNECELNNLCVLPEFRHKNIGSKLLAHAFDLAKSNNAASVNISIVDENIRLKKWYKSFGFEMIRTEKLDFFPFTCGYLKKVLNYG